MNNKEKGIIIFTTILFIGIFSFIGFQNRVKIDAKTVYQVYLDGKKLGLINNSEELLNMIDHEQTDIKNTYKVDKVYPPNGFEVVKYTTHKEDVTSSKEIYNKVKENGDFTIKGYTVTLTEKKENQQEKKMQINVLDEQVFRTSLEKVVTAFVEKEKFESYNNNSQEEINGVGEVIKYMSFEINPTIKEANISVNKKIYTDANELTQFLLFGKDNIEKKYIVNKGDTIKSIAENNKLNVNEFLIANPKFKSAESLLTIGEEVSVELVNPLLNLVEEMHAVEDVEQIYEKKQVVDNSKPSDYSEITQAGVTGIVRTTQEYKVNNGERTQGSVLISSVTMRETVDEITTVGKINNWGNPFETGKDWGWPTNRPYIISSYFEWRWGSMHDALDITGPGFGSPIYAARNGTVVEIVNNCPNIGYYGNWCGNSYGNHVLIDHGNGYFSIYAHLTQKLKVNVGDSISRGQIIGSMGSSGSSTGTHLHFGISIGKPYMKGSRWIDPSGMYR